ncbi:MAG: amidoligase family protein [Pseudomonadales bacterium]
MSDPRAPLPLPPKPFTRDGRLRRLGVELEMGGLDVEVLSAVVAEHVGGRAEVISRYEHRIDGDPAGPWQVELDFAYLKLRGRERAAADEGLAGQLDEAMEEVLAAGSQAIVPMEVVSPPLPLDRLHEVERLIARLRRAGARGTRDGLVFAFGLHLNPELPDTESVTIVRYLKAFVCLYDWLKAEARVDVLRRITVYIDHYPTRYVRKLVQRDYQPDQPQLIDDYLADNPTRNRALDMLPLFAFLDGDRVRGVVDDARIKGRPTLHYRLPNCEIDRADWGLENDWRRWLQVEHLAADPVRLDDLCSAYRAHLDKPLSGLMDSWAERVEAWLKDPNDL